jgi:3-dehydroquinate synthase
MAHGLNRKGLLIGFGGGVCLDVVTVAASLIRRGVGHLRVPTTLIGQIDAGIGLKGAVNFAGKKSFIGCFHPPEQVLVDPSLLRSLPRRAISSGFAESIKMGVIRDAALFELLEKSDCVSQEMLRLSIWSMLEELRKNPYEDQSYERVVDFGHTFSPLLEAAMGFELQHGEAVAIDIALSTMISHELGLIDAAVRDRILTVMHAAGLPIFAPKLELALCKEALTEAARHRGGAMNLVIPDGIGRAAFLRMREDLPDEVLAKALSCLGAAST